MTNNYKAALEKNTVAIKAFTAIQNDYRSRKLCDTGHIYVDPSGFVITPKGEKMLGGMDDSFDTEAAIARKD